MKLNLVDTLILSALVGCLVGLAIFLSRGLYLDLYFPGMMALGFGFWFIYRKGESFKNLKK